MLLSATEKSSQQIKMKKIIIVVLIFVLLSFSIIAVGELTKKSKIDKLKSITPTKKQKEQLENYYKDIDKGMKEVKEYRKSPDHVIISFNDTSWRVFTSKKHFNTIT